MAHTAKHSVSPEHGKFHRALGQSGPSCKRWMPSASTARGLEQRVGQHRHRPRER
jgi:hypothetical protein